MPSHHITLKFKNDLSELKRLKQAMDTFGASAGFPPKTIFTINLALEELLCNIIRYGYPENRSGHIDLSMEFKQDILTIDLEDDGIEFNPLDAQCPDLTCALESRKIGGLGIMLVKSVMDKVCYDRRGNINHLVLKKSVKK